MTDHSNEPPKPGDRVFNKLDWDSGPETIDRDLEALWNIYASDTTTNFAAFEILQRLASHWWDDAVKVDRPDPNFGMTPLAMVQVPWWVVHILGRCWHNYRSEKGKKAGEAFLLEGGGQGKRRRIDQFETKIRGMRIALEMAFYLTVDDGDRSQTRSVEDAVLYVEQRFAISSDTVWRAWKTYGPQARASLSRHAATAKTS